MTEIFLLHDDNFAYTNTHRQMSVGELSSLIPGTPVTLYCSTTDSDIYYHHQPEGDRVPVRATHYQLRATRYLVVGTVLYTECFENTYLVLEAVGEAATLTFGKQCLKISGLTTRKKIVHVPLSAIQRYKTGIEL